MLAKSVHGNNNSKREKNPSDCLVCHGGNPHTIPAPAISASRQNALCLRCHPVASAKMLANAHGKALAKPDDRLKCLTCHNGNPHAISSPLKLTKLEKNAQCETCHTGNAAQLAKSAHANTNMSGGNRPNCSYCHGDNFHQIIPAAQMAPTQKEAACKTCHSKISERLADSVHGQKHVKPGAASPGCLDCHGEGNPHGVISPTKLDRIVNQRSCENCHNNLAKSLSDSVHNLPDKVPGDHPTCFTCHGKDAHGMHSAPELTPKQKVEICAKCHSDSVRMARYGRTDAVEAYSRTYHGRAILRFHHTKEATCIDCHGLHGIQAPDKPNAATNPRNASLICSKCHQGNNMSFAYTYASHQRLKVDKSLIMPLEKMFYRLVSISVTTYISIMLLLAFIILFTKRLPQARIGWLHESYFVLALVGVIFALLTIITMRTMSILKETVVPHNTLMSAVILLIFAVCSIILGLFIVPRKLSRSKSNQS